jgi:hypothetical protein
MRIDYAPFMLRKRILSHCGELRKFEPNCFNKKLGKIFWSWLDCQNPLLVGLYWMCFEQ